MADTIIGNHPVCLHDKDIQKIEDALSDLEQVVEDTIEENINLGHTESNMAFLKNYKKQVANTKEALVVFKCRFGV